MALISHLHEWNFLHIPGPLCFVEHWLSSEKLISTLVEFCLFFAFGIAFGIALAYRTGMHVKKPSAKVFQLNVLFSFLIQT
jgi:hypothetical protein